MHHIHSHRVHLKYGRRTHVPATPGVHQITRASNRYPRATRPRTINAISVAPYPPSFPHFDIKIDFNARFIFVRRESWNWDTFDARGMEMMDKFYMAMVVHARANSETINNRRDARQKVRSALCLRAAGAIYRDTSWCSTYITKGLRISLRTIYTILNILLLLGDMFFIKTRLNTLFQLGLSVVLSDPSAYDNINNWLTLNWPRLKQFKLKTNRARCSGRRVCWDKRNMQTLPYHGHRCCWCLCSTLHIIRRHSN